MKIQLLTATAILAMFTATTASAGKLTINTYNDATNSVAVSNALGVAAAGGSGGFAGNLGLTIDDGRAIAGSVSVNADGRKCNCKIKVDVDNRSQNAVAVGGSTAGSTVVRL